jgi:hypothetical protein
MKGVVSGGDGEYISGRGTADDSCRDGASLAPSRRRLCRQHRDRRPTHGYAVTREAMTAFAKSWRRE